MSNNNLPSNNKIEDRAIGTLKNVIDDDLTMMQQFNSMDKEMAWDGYIWIFKNNNGNQSKANVDDKIPVQIKGHIDEKAEYINKETISYAVDLIDLDIYFNDRGVVYFEIFMSKDGKRREVFYTSLYPSKIKSYLERATKKGNKETINIPFRKMKKDPKDLYVVLKQFSKESRRQGFGSGEIVQNTISLENSDKLTSITATAIGAKNEYEFLQRVATGDVCFYGSTEDNKIKVPIEWDEDGIYFIQHEIKKRISVDNVVYYEEYRVSMSSQKSNIIFLSDNLRIDLSKSKINFTPKTQIEQIRKDAEFLLAFIKNEKFYVEDHECNWGKLTAPEDFSSSLKYFIDLDNALKEIQFNYEEPHEAWTTEVREQMTKLVGMKRGRYNHNFTEKVHLYNWKIEDKYLPIVVSRHTKDNSNDLTNAIETKTLRTSVSDGNGNRCIVPVIAFIDWYAMRKLYKYDYEYLYEQINCSEINECTRNQINHAALKLISAYDENGDAKLLEIALYYLEKIHDLEKEKEYYQINLFQIKKRLGTFNEMDTAMLNSWNNQSIDLNFAKYVLLENIKNANEYWEKLEDKCKKEMREYPIYNLYNKLSTEVLNV